MVEVEKRNFCNLISSSSDSQVGSNRRGKTQILVSLAQIMFVRWRGLDSLVRWPGLIKMKQNKNYHDVWIPPVMRVTAMKL